MKKLYLAFLVGCLLCSCSITHRERNYLDKTTPELGLGKLGDNLQLSEYQVKFPYTVNAYPPFWTKESKALTILENIELKRRLERENDQIRTKLLAEQQKFDMKSNNVATAADSKPITPNKPKKEVINILSGLYYRAVTEIDSTNKIVENSYLWGIFDSNK